MSAAPHFHAVRLLERIAARKGQRITGRDVAAIAYAMSVVKQLAEMEAKHMRHYSEALHEKLDAEAKRDALVSAIRDGLEVAT